MTAALAILTVAAIVVPLAHRRWPRAAVAGACTASGLAGVVIASATPAVVHGEPVSTSVAWVEAIGVAFALRLDGLSAMYGLLVTGIGVLVLAYTPGYMHGAPGTGRLLGLLLAFETAMLGLVLADDAITMFVFWELTSITSYALIAFEDDLASRKKARQALIITSAGGLAMLVGLVLAAWATSGTVSVALSSLAVADLHAHPYYAAIVVLVAAGAFTKSAQVPFQFWLPGAMVAPTPVSAYLHSATMVNAGVYLLMRLHPALGGTALWTGLIATTGAVTLLVGAALATVQRDLKLTLAYSTIAILGALTMLVGIGSEAAIVAAVALALAHALYKAALFLVAGNVSHATGTRDPFAGVADPRAMPWTLAAAVLAAASMAGAPVLFGFIAKDAMFAAVLGAPGGIALAAVTALAACGIVASAWISGVAPFRGARARSTGDVHAPSSLPGPMRAAPLVLAGSGALLGLAPFVVEDVVGAAASAIAGAPLRGGLALWHGTSGVYGQALLIGVCSLALGSAIYAWISRGPHRVDSARDAVGRVAGGRAFEAMMDGLHDGATALTRRVQHGRLHGYLATVVLSVLVVVTVPLLFAEAGPWQPEVQLSPAEIPILIVAAAGAIVGAAVRDRLATVAAFGATGLAVTFLFALFSAPDLAITQLSVETIMVILLVLAFRRVPASLARTHDVPVRAMRVAIAVGAGALVTSLLVLATAATPFARDASTGQVALAAEAGAFNVVNAILVNFRATDTLGETAVVAMAGVGVLTLLGGHLARADASARTSSALLRLAPTRAIIVGLLAILSLFALLRGHTEPGGGFVGGLLLASALAVPLISHGAREARRTLRADPRTLVGAGIAAIAVAAVAGLALDGSLLAPWEGPAVPTVGHLGTVLLFDVGVYLVVAGTALTIILSLVEDR